MYDTMKPPVSFLVVEDDRVDVELFRYALKKANLAPHIYHAETGNIALDMLQGTNGQEKITSPLILLVDLNMPLMNGIEMLKKLRDNEKLKGLVAFVLTTSAREKDKVDCYDLNVAGYFLKKNLDQLVATLAPYCNGNQFKEEVT